MARRTEFDRLLKSACSPHVAQQLIEWADETQGAIDRNEMMIGLLTLEEVEQIPVAYRRAVECGEPSAWLSLAQWYANPKLGDPNLELAEQALASAIAADVTGAKLRLAQTRWFYKQDTATEAEQRAVVQLLRELIAADASDHEAI